MFKIILWTIYFISVVGMFAMTSTMLCQTKKKIKESGLAPVKTTSQMKLTGKLILLIFSLAPVVNTLFLFYTFLHFEELVEDSAKKVLNRD